jgi:hypothetical protein
VAIGDLIFFFSSSFPPASRNGPYASLAASSFLRKLGRLFSIWNLQVQWEKFGIRVIMFS